MGERRQLSPESFYCGAGRITRHGETDCGFVYPDEHEPTGEPIGLLRQPHARHSRERPPGVDRPVYGKRRTDIRQYEIRMRNRGTAGHQAHHRMLAQCAGHFGVDSCIRSGEGGQRPWMCRRRRTRVRGCGGIDVGERAGPVVCRAHEIHFGKTDTVWIAGKFLLPTIRRNWAMVRTLRRSSRQR